MNKGKKVLVLLLLQLMFLSGCSVDSKYDWVIDNTQTPEFQLIEKRLNDGLIIQTLPQSGMPAFYVITVYSQEEAKTGKYELFKLDLAQTEQSVSLKDSPNFPYKFNVIEVNIDTSISKPIITLDSSETKSKEIQKNFTTGLVTYKIFNISISIPQDDGDHSKYDSIEFLLKKNRQ